ncbi:hypothetical protein PIB30_045347 [Stylosanthes scabra]|uniref:Uncharacterized protein n=1 Tax=Stylosanthes scabra TaxID=79078 RepID=A0ABU6QFJ6_9FABA|nr:hypothetical protein [Stylosanthes scabra]
MVLGTKGGMSLRKTQTIPSTKVEAAPSEPRHSAPQLFVGASIVETAHAIEAKVATSVEGKRKGFFADNVVDVSPLIRYACGVTPKPTWRLNAKRMGDWEDGWWDAEEKHEGISLAEGNFSEETPLESGAMEAESVAAEVYSIEGST